MATINFSVPDELKREFQETFAEENKSAIVARLMRQAIEEKRRQRRRTAAIDEILELRKRFRPATGQEIHAARTENRP